MEVVPMAVTKSCSMFFCSFVLLCFVLVLSLRREREREWNEEDEEEEKYCVPIGSSRGVGGCKQHCCKKILSSEVLSNNGSTSSGETTQ